ncbi:MAG: amidase [Geminicoccaceae bacterium]
MKGRINMASATRRSFLVSSTAVPLLSASPILAQMSGIDELVDLDATDLAELLRRREISQTELVNIVIRRIEVMNPALNFMTNKAYERALEKAETVPLNTPFAGVPILMKDMIDVGGVPRTDGSRMMLENVPAKNVAYVDAVEAAGLNILGMTNVPELASFILTNNEVFGATRNPWQPAYSAWGSSGGTAAAVAAGVVPMAHGTDGAGSNRLPPSATGIFGMKPSRERMLSGEADGSHDISKTNQMISRTVRDSAAAFAHTEDESGLVFEPVGLVESPSAARLRVGLVMDDGILHEIEPEIREVQLKTAALLENLGHAIEETPWPVDGEAMVDGYIKFFAGNVDPLIATFEKIGKTPSETNLVTPLLASFIESLEGRYTAEEIEDGADFMRGLSTTMADVFENYDVLLAPVSPVMTPRLDTFTPMDLWTDEVEAFMTSQIKFTTPANFAGIPAMSVPLFWSPSLGLPIGSHFIAAGGNDRMLYELAYELEEARPWRDIWAPFSLKYIPV